MTSGQCPFCGVSGPVGQPCTGRGCRRNGYHFIPSEHARAAEGAGPGGRDPLIGRRVDEWLLVDRIGAGGFGSVYLALQMPLGLRAALKVLRLDNLDKSTLDSAARRFEGEARALANLNHPNVVRLLKYGQWEGGPYMVMEFVAGGRTLKSEVSQAALAGRPFDATLARHVLAQVLMGLQAAHTAGIIHRDIKPENIMLQQVVGDPNHVRIVDFGLAKVWDASGQTSVVLGTPMYMAPEQMLRRDLGPWTDLYAVGVVAFELLLGRRPFPFGEDALVKAKLDGAFDPVDIPEFASGGPLASFLRTALAADPGERFRQAEAMRGALLHALDSLDVTHPISLSAQGLVDSRELARLRDEKRSLADERRAVEAEREALAQERARLTAERQQTPAVSKVPAEPAMHQTHQLEIALPAPTPHPWRRSWVWGAAALAVVAAGWVGISRGLQSEGDQVAGLPPPTTDAGSGVAAVGGGTQPQDSTAGASRTHVPEVAEEAGGPPVVVPAPANAAKAGDVVEPRQPEEPTEVAALPTAVGLGDGSADRLPEGTSGGSAGRATAADAALAARDWSRAEELLGEILASNPGDNVAASKLQVARAEARTKAGLAKAKAEVKAGDLAGAWASLSEVRALSTGSVYHDEIEALHGKVRGSFAADQVARARKAVAGGDLKGAKDLLRGALDVDPGNGAAWTLMRNVVSKIAVGSQAGGIGTKSPVVPVRGSGAGTGVTAAAGGSARAQSPPEPARSSSPGAGAPPAAGESGESGATPVPSRGDGARLYHEGRQAKIQGNLGFAVERFKAAASAGYADAHKQLGVIYASQGKSKDAVFHYTMYLSRKPAAPDAPSVETAIRRLKGLE